MKKEHAENLQKALNEKRAELERNQKKLDSLKIKVEDLEAKQTEAEETMVSSQQNLDDKEQEISALRQMVEKSVGNEEVETANKKHDEEKGKLNRREFWVTALQLRVQTMLRK